MPLEVPNLDDRTWAQLVDEARSLIPRVSPQWTDHNVHDPGITFIELFAWLAEMQLYQLNRVGQRQREAFAQLAGVTREQRKPARVDIHAEGTPPETIFVPAGTQLMPTEGQEIIFETDTDLFLTRTRLVKVITNDGAGPIDQTQANEKPGIAFLVFGETAAINSELRLGFDRFYPNEQPTMTLTLQVFTDDLVEPCGAVGPIALDDAEDYVASVGLVWEYWGSGQRWLPLNVNSDRSRAFARSGAITFTVPNNAVAQSNLFWIRARVRSGAYVIEPRLRSISLNVLPCLQRETVRNEFLGVGTSKPDQYFTLKKKPVLVPQDQPAVVIEVDDDIWQPVTSLTDSDPSSKHYVFNPETGVVDFGNGLNGAVPKKGQQIRALSYQTSTGSSGNVAKDLSWRSASGVITGVVLTNREPAADGSDGETLSQLELRTRALLNRQHRAVTLKDLEQHALSTPNAFVARAKAITNCPVPESITVVAVPKVRPGRKAPPGSPSPLFLSMVQRNLQRRRILCDSLYVVPPVYVEVKITARLRLTKGASVDGVLTRAREAIDSFLLGELQPSDKNAAANTDSGRTTSTTSACFTRWPFGRWVFPSEVYAVLDGVKGIDFASELTLSASRSGAAVQANQNGAIPIPQTGLVFPGVHNFTMEFDTRRTA